MAAPGPVLVSGATGLVGTRLVAALRRDGIPVRILSRRPEEAVRSLAKGVDAVAWNGLDAPPGAVEGTRAVVHLAGEPLFRGRLTRSRRRLIAESRILSTRSISEAIAALPETGRPDVFICASAVGLFGSRGENPLDDAASPGTGFLAELCRNWEAEAARARTRSVSLRMAVVLAREGGALPLMSRPFRFGLGGRIGDGRQWFPWIHIDDLVAMIRRAMSDDAMNGGWNAAAPEPVRNAELTRAIADALGRPAWLPVPGIVLRLALGELSEELLGSRRVVPRRALDLGFDFAYPRLVPALAAELGAKPRPRPDESDE